MRAEKTLKIFWWFGSIVVIAAVATFIYVRHRSALALRQAMIHQKGASVMPFNLNMTTHVFKKTGDGGV